MKLATFVTFKGSDPKIPYNFAKGVLHLTKQEEKLVLQLHGAPEKHSLVIQDIAFQEKTKLVVFYSNLAGLIILNHDDLFKSKDLWAYTKQTECFGDPVANIYFHTSWEDSLFFSNVPLVTEEEPITTVEGHTYIHDWIASQYPPGECVVADNTNLRLAAFKDVHLVDAVVALEQQVDLLTKLVKGLLRSEVEPAWAANFLDKMELYSTCTVRSVEDNIEKAAEYKQKVRTAQIDYLTKRKT